MKCEILVTCEEDLEKALKKQKEIRDKMFDIGLKTRYRDISDIEKNLLNQEFLKLKKQFAGIATQIAQYKIENEQKKEGIKK